MPLLQSILPPARVGIARAADIPTRLVCLVVAPVSFVDAAVGGDAGAAALPDHRSLSPLAQIDITVGELMDRAIFNRT